MLINPAQEEDIEKVMTEIRNISTPVELEAFNELDKEGTEAPENAVGPAVTTPEAEAPQVVTPETASTPAPAPAPTVATILIDDNYINNAPLEEQGILRSIKGEVTTPKFLKNYVNAQKLIGKKTISPVEVNTPQPQQIQKPVETTPASNVKHQMVISQLKGMYPDIPEGVEEYREWINDLNYSDSEKFFRFMQNKSRIESAVEEDYSKLEYVRDNYATINSQAITNSIQTITSELAEIGVRPEDLGIALTDGEDSVFNTLVGDGQGGYDKMVVQDIFGTKVINPDAIVDKFWRVYKPQVFQRIKAIGVRDGAQALADKQRSLPKTMVNSGVPVRQKPATADDVKMINDRSEVDRLINDLR